MYGIVNVIIGHIQNSPDETSLNSDEVLYGMKVNILKTIDENWYYIRTHYNYEGYIKKNELIVNESEVKDYEKSKKALCMAAFADVLNRPDYNGKQIITLTRGAKVAMAEEKEENNQFVKVKLADKRTGYVRKEFLIDKKEDYKSIEENILRRNIANAALSYIGTQYRWGGKSPMGIDCSGLCSMAYMLNNILIYRDAVIKEGFPVKEISFQKVKMGDLLFFKGHVAMYLGNQQYIHSSTTNNGVKINSFNKCHYNYFKKLDNKLLAAGSIF